MPGHAVEMALLGATGGFGLAAAYNAFYARRFAADALPVRLVVQAPLAWTGAFVNVEGVLDGAQVSPASLTPCAAWMCTCRRRGAWAPATTYGATNFMTRLQGSDGASIEVRVTSAPVHVKWVMQPEEHVRDHDRVAAIFTRLGLADAAARVAAEAAEGVTVWIFQERLAPLNVPCFLSARVVRSEATHNAMLETSAVVPCVYFTPHRQHCRNMRRRAALYGAGMLGIMGLGLYWIIASGALETDG